MLQLILRIKQQQKNKQPISWEEHLSLEKPAK
jgi:hypothetical protein